MSREDKAQARIDAGPVDLADEDIIKAMQSIPGYIDITTSDFKEIYKPAFSLAMDRLSRSRQASDVMTRDVVSVRADTPLQETAAIMARQNVSGLPVLDADHQVLGVISDKDFLTRLGGAGIRSFMHFLAQRLAGKVPVIADLSTEKARDIMTAPAVTVTETTTVSDITRLLEAREINRVPVLDQNGRLTGIVTRTDIVQTASTD